MYSGGRGFRSFSTNYGSDWPYRRVEEQKLNSGDSWKLGTRTSETWRSSSSNPSESWVSRPSSSYNYNCEESFGPQDDVEFSTDAKGSQQNCDNNRKRNGESESKDVSDSSNDKRRKISEDEDLSFEEKAKLQLELIKQMSSVGADEYEEVTPDELKKDKKIVEIDKPSEPTADTKHENNTFHPGNKNSSGYRPTYKPRGLSWTEAHKKHVEELKARVYGPNPAQYSNHGYGPPPSYSLHRNPTPGHTEYPGANYGWNNHGSSGFWGQGAYGYNAPPGYGGNPTGGGNVPSKQGCHAPPAPDNSDSSTEREYFANQGTDYTSPSGTSSEVASSNLNGYQKPDGPARVELQFFGGPVTLTATSNWERKRTLLENPSGSSKKSNPDNQNFYNGPVTAMPNRSMDVKDLKQDPNNSSDSEEDDDIIRLREVMNTH